MGAKRNAVTGLITQLIIIALGLIVPRIMITNYGSDTNGLTNTLTQIFSYIALLEAGIGQSTRNALYKPITENDRDGVFLNVQARNSKTPHFHIGSNVLVTHMLGEPHHNY